MAAPAETWTDIALADVLSGDMPKEAVLDAIRTNQEHLKEILYDSHTPTVTTAWVSLASTDTDADSPIDTTLMDAIRDRTQNLYEALQSHKHNADGDGEEHDPAVQENLLHAGLSLLEKDTPLWTRSGWPRDSSDEGRTGLCNEKAINKYIYQIIGRYSATSKEMLGANGGDFVVSFLMRSADDQTTGALEFGFSDASSSAWITGQSVEIGPDATSPATDIPTEWTRFYWRTTGAGAGVSTDFRFLMRITTAFTHNLSLCACQISQGNRLTPFTMSNFEGAIGSGVMWQMKASAPIFDETVMLRNAVEVT